MSHVESEFVFVNEPLGSVDPDSKKFRKKAIRARAARQAPPIVALQSITPIKSASTWNRYQARTRKRRKTKLYTFPLDTSVLVQSNVQGNALNAKIDSSDEKPDHSSLSVGVTGLVKSESTRSSEKAAGSMLSRLGGGWVAPFVPPESLSKSYCPLLLEHCTPSGPSVPSQIRSGALLTLFHRPRQFGNRHP